VVYRPRKRFFEGGEEEPHFRGEKKRANRRKEGELFQTRIYSRGKKRGNLNKEAPIPLFHYEREKSCHKRSKKKGKGGIGETSFFKKKRQDLHEGEKREPFISKGKG